MTTPSAKYLDQPFDEAIGFFRQKVSLPTKRWDDIQAGMHARAFVVAGAMKTELLSDLRGAVDKAISKGTTLAEFRKDFDSLVAKHGWKYKGGRGWRTATIYNTNLATAYAAGHWQQMTDPDVLAARPFLRYLRTSSGNPRAEHLAWADTVLPATDPWWQTHYPPNGWGCKCGVASHSAREVERMQAEGKWLRTKAPKTESYDYTDKQTGEIVRMPKGIDPGWNYNVGQAAYGRRLSAENMAAWRAQGAGAWERLTPGNVATFSRPEMIPADEPVAAIGPKLATIKAASESLKGILGADEKVFSFQQGNFRHNILVNAETLAAHVDLDRTPYLPFLSEAMTDPFEIWLAFEKHKGTGQVALRQRIIKAIKVGKDRGLLVVVQSRNGVMEAWTMVPTGDDMKYLNRQREGKLIFGRN